MLTFSLQPSLTIAGAIPDHFGRRVSKTVNGTMTRFLYDGPEIIAETDNAWAVQGTYVFGPGVDQPLRMTRGATTSYFHADRLGSIIALSTAAGAVAETYKYDTFGRPSNLSTLGNRLLFTGREYDAETGLYYYRARYHDPRLGRFLSRDPLSYGPDEHLYRYVGNAPTTWRDPLGLFTTGLGGWTGPLGDFGGGDFGGPGGFGGWGGGDFGSFGGPVSGAGGDFSPPQPPAPQGDTPGGQSPGKCPQGDRGSGPMGPGYNPAKPDNLPKGGDKPFEPKKQKGGGIPRRDGGFVDKKGNVWEWDPRKGEWDVQHPDGSHTNVGPDGNITHGPDNF